MSTTRLQALQREGDPILSSIVRGYTNEEYIADKVVPVVTVEKDVGKIPLFGKGRFIVFDSKRALRAGSNEVDIEDWKLEPYELEEYDLAIPLDYREINAATGSNYKIKAEAAEAAMEGIVLSKEKMIAEVLQNSSTYPAGHVTVLSGTDLWTDPASKPLEVIRDCKATVRAKIGRDPNTLTLSAKYWEALIDHPGLKELIKYSQTAVLTKELLKQLFMVDEIIVGKAVTADSGTGDFTDIWNNTAILTFVNPRPSVRAPSFGYTLRQKGKPVGDEYSESGNKVVKVRATDIRTTKIVGNEAGYLIKQ